MNSENNVILDLNRKPVLTVGEVADLLGVCKGAVYTLCHRADFPALKIGKSYRIPTARFVAWLENVPTGVSD